MHLHHHDHDHGIGRTGNRARMRVALAINGVLLVAGVAGAVLFDSVALLADAGHVLSDVGAIAIGLFAAADRRAAAGRRRTFGFHRGEILAALVNGVGLVVVAVIVIVESIGRLSDPPDVQGVGVLVVGVIGLAGNVAATFALAGGDREDLNLEGVLRHSVADALGSLGVIVAGRRGGHHGLALGGRHRRASRSAC